MKIKEQLLFAQGLLLIYVCIPKNSRPERIHRCNNYLPPVGTPVPPVRIFADLTLSQVEPFR